MLGVSSLPNNYKKRYDVRGLYLRFPESDSWELLYDNPSIGDVLTACNRRGIQKFSVYFKHDPSKQDSRSRTVPYYADAASRSERICANKFLYAIVLCSDLDECLARCAVKTFRNATIHWDGENQKDGVLRAESSFVKNAVEVIGLDTRRLITACDASFAENGKRTFSDAAVAAALAKLLFHGAHRSMQDIRDWVARLNRFQSAITPNHERCKLLTIVAKCLSGKNARAEQQALLETCGENHFEANLMLTILRGYQHGPSLALFSRFDHLSEYQKCKLLAIDVQFSRDDEAAMLHFKWLLQRVRRMPDVVLGIEKFVIPAWAAAAWRTSVYTYGGLDQFLRDTLSPRELSEQKKRLQLARVVAFICSRVVSKEQRTILIDELIGSSARSSLNAEKVSWLLEFLEPEPEEEAQRYWKFFRRFKSDVYRHWKSAEKVAQTHPPPPMNDNLTSQGIRACVRGFEGQHDGSWDFWKPRMGIVRAQKDAVDCFTKFKPSSQVNPLATKVWQHEANAYNLLKYRRGSHPEHPLMPIFYFTSAGLHVHEHGIDLGRIDWTPMQSSTVLGVISDLLKAVTQLHGLGAAHLDLSPGNVVVDLEGKQPSVRLIDFQSAVWVNSTSRFVTQDVVRGTRGFAAPEIGTIDSLHDAQRADVFSVCRLVWYLLLGFHGMHPGELLSDADLKATGLAVTIDGFRVDARSRPKLSTLCTVIDTAKAHHLTAIDELRKRWAFRPVESAAGDTMMDLIARKHEPRLGVIMVDGCTDRFFVQFLLDIAMRQSTEHDQQMLRRIREDAVIVSKERSDFPRWLSSARAAPRWLVCLVDYDASYPGNTKARIQEFRKHIHLPWPTSVGVMPTDIFFCPEMGYSVENYCIPLSRYTKKLMSRLETQKKVASKKEASEKAAAHFMKEVFKGTPGKAEDWEHVKTAVLAQFSHGHSVLTSVAGCSCRWSVDHYHRDFEQLEAESKSLFPKKPMTAQLASTIATGIKNEAIAFGRLCLAKLSPDMWEPRPRQRNVQPWWSCSVDAMFAIRQYVLDVLAKETALDVTQEAWLSAWYHLRPSDDLNGPNVHVTLESPLSEQLESVLRVEQECIRCTHHPQPEREKENSAVLQKEVAKWQWSKPMTLKSLSIEAFLRDQRAFVCSLSAKAAAAHLPFVLTLGQIDGGLGVGASTKSGKLSVTAAHPTSDVTKRHPKLVSTAHAATRGCLQFDTASATPVAFSMSASGDGKITQIEAKSVAFVPDRIGWLNDKTNEALVFNLGYVKHPTSQYAVYTDAFLQLNGDTLIRQGARCRSTGIFAVPGSRICVMTIPSNVKFQYETTADGNERTKTVEDVSLLWDNPVQIQHKRFVLIAHIAGEETRFEVKGNASPITCTLLGRRVVVFKGAKKFSAEWHLGDAAFAFTFDELELGTPTKQVAHQPKK